MPVLKYIENKNSISLYRIIEGKKVFIQEFIGENVKQQMLEYIDVIYETAILIIED